MGAYRLPSALGKERVHVRGAGYVYTRCGALVIGIRAADGPVRPVAVDAAPAIEVIFMSSFVPKGKALAWLPVVALLLIGPVAVPIAAAAQLPTEQASQAYAPFTEEELDDLLAPVALYPDPLLALILPASTYIDDLTSADHWLSRHKHPSDADIDKQPWDISVRALAHYPSVVHYLATNPDWTTALGQAYVQQKDDVMASIQRLRHRAMAAGTLKSNREQKVYTEGSDIRIVPAQPTVIYVPEYNPALVYVEPVAGVVVPEDFIFFGVGFPIGSWLCLDIDWHHHDVFYHGWHGGGWTADARPHIRLDRTYVNERFASRPWPIDRDVLRRPVHFNAIHPWLHERAVPGVRNRFTGPRVRTEVPRASSGPRTGGRRSRTVPLPRPYTAPLPRFGAPGRLESPRGRAFHEGGAFRESRGIGSRGLFGGEARRFAEPRVPLPRFSAPEIGSLRGPGRVESPGALFGARPFAGPRAFRGPGAFSGPRPPAVPRAPGGVRSFGGGASRGSGGIAGGFRGRR